MQRSRKGAFDLEDEVGIVAEAVRLPLDDLDLVVDAFQSPRADGIEAVVQDPLRVSQQIAGEGRQGGNPTFLRQGAPLIERFPGPRRMLVSPDPL